MVQTGSCGKNPFYVILSNLHSKIFYLHLRHTCQVDTWKCVFHVVFDEFLPHVKVVEFFPNSGYTNKGGKLV